MKSFVAAVAALVLSVAGLSAGESKEVKGQVKKVDADKSAIVVVVDGKAVEYVVAKDAKITQAPPAKKSKKHPTPTELTDGLKSVKAKSRVVLTTETMDGKDVVTALKVESAAKEKKKKDK